MSWTIRSKPLRPMTSSSLSFFPIVKERSRRRSILGLSASKPCSAFRHCVSRRNLSLRDTFFNLNTRSGDILGVVGLHRRAEFSLLLSSSASNGNVVGFRQGTVRREGRSLDTARRGRQGPQPCSGRRTADPEKSLESKVCLPCTPELESGEL